MEYTIKDLSRLINKSEVSIYKLINKKKDFAEIVNKNSRIDPQNHSKLYAQPCLDWLSQYYKIQLVDDGVGKTILENEKGKNPNNNAPLNQVKTGLEDYEAEIKRLKKRIKHLKAERKQLRSENDRLFNENSRILTLLENEQKGRLMSVVVDNKRLLEESPTKSHWWQRKKI